MANINTELEQIRKAVYGREVRGSIANAIELINKEQISTSTAQTNLDSKFNQLIINAGNSNAEVVASRVKADGTQFDTLSKRLDKGDEAHSTLNNEVIGARTDSKNVTHKNLKVRLDNFDSQLDTIENNHLTISVKDFGAKGDGLKDDTIAIQNAINKARELQCTLYFPNGTYLCKKIDIQGKYIEFGDDLNIALIGESSKNTIIKCIDDNVLFNFYGQYTTRRCQLRNVVIKSLKFLSDNLNNLAFKFNICQHFTLEDLWIQGFKDGVFNYTDTFDFQYNNIDIFQCGRALNSDDYAYPITFNTNVDNCNAHKFLNSRLEYCPLFIKSVGNNRHNFFTNCKFEKGTINNNSSFSPFYFQDVRELSFNQCFFTYASKTQNKPLDGGIAYITSLSSNTSPTVQHIKFTNCNFACSGDSRCVWYKGNGTLFAESDFYGIVSDMDNYISFDMRENNVMNSCKVLLNDDVRLINLNGSNNIINNLIITSLKETPLKPTFLIQSGANNNIIEYSLTRYQLNRDFISASSSFNVNGCIMLGTNIIRNKNEKVLTSTSYIPRINCNIIKQDTNKLKGINYMYDGQIVTIIFKQQCVVENSTNLITLTNSNTTFNTDSIAKFVNLDNVIYQI